MEAEFRDIDSKNAWTQVYQQIRQQSNNYKYTCQAARKAENKNLNRYRDVSPYDHTRVCLQRGKGDYINASLVEVPEANRAYILTQGPLPATTGHFWLMVWEQKSRAVLMLNKVLEKNAVKCHQYWPMGGEEDKQMTFTDVNLTVTFSKEMKNSNYTLRELLLKDLESGEKRVILHFHYTSWPDFGVPESPSAFLDFLMAVRQYGVLERSVGPPIVHCSAGIGRSGTFCLVDSCLAIIEKTRDPSSVSVQNMLLEMRRFRMGLIQTADQLRFSYLAILAGEKYCTHNNNNNNKGSSRSTPESSAVSQDKEGNVDVLDNPSSSSPDDVCMEQALQKEEEEEDIAEEFEREDGSPSPPPPLPPRVSRTTDPEVEQLPSVVSPDEDLDKKRDLRRRKRQEDQEQLANKVQRMRQKQKDAETSSKRRLLVKRLSFGIVLLMGTSILVYRYYLKS